MIEDKKVLEIRKRVVENSETEEDEIYLQEYYKEDIDVAWSLCFHGFNSFDEMVLFYENCKGSFKKEDAAYFDSLLPAIKSGDVASKRKFVMWYNFSSWGISQDSFCSGMKKAREELKKQKKDAK